MRDPSVPDYAWFARGAAAEWGWSLVFWVLEGDQKKQGSSTKYANAHGIHSYKPRWGQCLRLTARFGFACVRMMPMDVEAIFRFHERAVQIQWPWEGFAMAITMVASALKWPVAIDAFQAAFQQTSSTRSRCKRRLTLRWQVPSWLPRRSAMVWSWKRCTLSCRRPGGLGAAPV